MRLLIVASPMISRGGVYSWLHDAVPILRSQGWSIGLLWSARVDAPPPQADWEFRLEESGDRLGRMRALPRAVKGALDSFRPEGMLSVLPQSDLACARARPRVPWVAMAHGRPFPGAGEGSAPRRWAWQASVKWAYHRADRVVTVSNDLAEELSGELGLDRVETVHNGVRLPAAEPRRSRRGRTVGFLGRLSREKAPDLFLECVRGVECEALLFGDGPLMESLRSSAESMPHVRVEGWSEREKALAAIDLLVVPSRREAFGLSCVEAGARRIPVLARGIGGIGEILGQDPELRRTCLMPASASPQDFAKRIELMLSNPDLRLDLASRLHTTVAERFALPDRVLELGSILEASSNGASSPSSTATV